MSGRLPEEQGLMQDLRNWGEREPTTGVQGQSLMWAARVQ